ncbi:hypothetical protein TWF696_005913 [Orbilia brochopaga]|uniref:Uncharacterized protein n=1 Tax=Orbilia brochopaga TaxID=3140254 RepID=A0AAV9V120_9PEZI
MSISETEAAIYSEFHDIFRGGKAAYRKPKTILKTFDDNLSLKSRLNLFCSSSGIPQASVLDTIKHLLEEEVFASPIKAKLRFPHIFQLSAGQLKEKEKWESEAAMSEAGAIAQSLQVNKIDGFDPPETEEPQVVPTKRKKSASVEKRPYISIFAPPRSEVGNPLDGSTTSLSPTATAHTPVVLQKEVEAVVYGEEVVDTVESKLPNLFPVYLPYPVQHKLTTEAQRILEHVCYDFVKTWLPEKTATEQFANPENAELPMWARLIKKKLKDLPAKSHDKSALKSESLLKVVVVIENLRHTAVHRLKTQSKGIEDMLEKAVMFAAFLKDERAEKLYRLLNKATELSSALENDKILLHNKLKQELKEIEEAIRVLKQREESALKRILEDDRLAREAISFDLADLEEEAAPENQTEDANVNFAALTDSQAVQNKAAERVSEVNDDKRPTPLFGELNLPKEGSIDYSDPDLSLDMDDLDPEELTEPVQPMPARYSIDTLLGINIQHEASPEITIAASNKVPKVKPVTSMESIKGLLIPDTDVESREAISVSRKAPSGSYADDTAVPTSIMKQVQDVMDAILSTQPKGVEG